LDSARGSCLSGTKGAPELERFFTLASKILLPASWSLSFQPGDRVGIWSLNRFEWAITRFAATEAGLIPVTINPAYRLYELEFAFNKVGCAGLVISPPFKISDYRDCRYGRRYRSVGNARRAFVRVIIPS
jgi:acyl-coenzyme A synthetase/AMP-(fatty) acid ligase